MSIRVAVVGAGIVGLAAASAHRILLRPTLSPCYGKA
jgi:threonine dehydrogenase-like Zn-dependent dehydrogenase